MKTIINICFTFFICYLSAPWPTLGYWGENLIGPMLITTFLSIFDPRVSGSLVKSLCIDSSPHPHPPPNFLRTLLRNLQSLYSQWSCLYELFSSDCWLGLYNIYLKLQRHYACLSKTFSDLTLLEGVNNYVRSVSLQFVKKQLFCNQEKFR